MKLSKLAALGIVLSMPHLANAQTTNPAPYCAAVYDNAPPFAQHYISNVTFGTLANNTGTTPIPDPNYLYYNNLTAPNLQTGATYPLSVAHNGSPDLLFAAVYIDFNHNNSFADAGERVLQHGGITSTVPNPAIATVTIPAGAALGATRMRVMVFEDPFFPFANATPCTTTGSDTLYWGETEDYNVNITNTPASVTSLTVSTQNNAPATITTNAGTRQMVATVMPAAANQNVTWSIVGGTGTATINATGLVTAQTNGTVWAKAVSVGNTSIKDSMQITISNQTTQVTSLTVSTQNNAPATITTHAGTRQMVATVLPATANQGVTWSIVSGTGTATISAGGVVTAQTNGTVWAKAVSNQNAARKDSMQIVITNQTLGVEDIGNAKAIQMYPNPVTRGVLTITVEENLANQSLNFRITDLAGRVVKKGELTGKETMIDIHDVPSGTYLVNIVGDRIGVRHELIRMAQ